MLQGLPATYLTFSFCASTPYSHGMGDPLLLKGASRFSFLPADLQNIWARIVGKGQQYIFKNLLTASLMRFNQNAFYMEFTGNACNTPQKAPAKV